MITELYIDLRRRVNAWASLTKQTSQARMGYVGQHLASVVTGLEGSRTGARGDDLIAPDGKHSEVKTCYRVDQLGECSVCGFKVAIADKVCSLCGSDRLKRKDDSKWLIGLPANDMLAKKKFASLFENESFYLVLFEFEDLASPEVIVTSIWEVNPRYRGFAYCMLDYYKNIWANSVSHAPFNLWPYSVKFYLMKPELIYQAKINQDDTIDTIRFPEVDAAPNFTFPSLSKFTCSVGFNVDVCRELATRFMIDVTGKTRLSLMSEIEEYRKHEMCDDALFVDVVNDVFYARIMPYRHEIPCVVS
ncbi:MAG: MamI family restriction endonuclease [Oligosphaeraceae bacterium]